MKISAAPSEIKPVEGKGEGGSAEPAAAIAAPPPHACGAHSAGLKSHCSAALPLMIAQRQAAAAPAIVAPAAGDSARAVGAAGAGRGVRAMLRCIEKRPCARR